MRQTAHELKNKKNRKNRRTTSLASVSSLMQNNIAESDLRVQLEFSGTYNLRNLTVTNVLEPGGLL